MTSSVSWSTLRPSGPPMKFQPRVSSTYPLPSSSCPFPAVSSGFDQSASRRSTWVVSTPPSITATRTVCAGSRSARSSLRARSVLVPGTPSRFRSRLCHPSGADSGAGAGVVGRGGTVGAAAGLAAVGGGTGRRWARCTTRQRPGKGQRGHRTERDASDHGILWVGLDRGEDRLGPDRLRAAGLREAERWES